MACASPLLARADTQAPERARASLLQWASLDVDGQRRGAAAALEFHSGLARCEQPAERFQGGLRICHVVTVDRLETVALLRADAAHSSIRTLRTGDLLM